MSFTHANRPRSSSAVIDRKVGQSGSERLGRDWARSAASSHAAPGTSLSSSSRSSRGRLAFDQETSPPADHRQPSDGASVRSALRHGRSGRPEDAGTHRGPVVALIGVSARPPTVIRPKNATERSVFVAPGQGRPRHLANHQFTNPKRHAFAGSRHAGPGPVPSWSCWRRGPLGPLEIRSAPSTAIDSFGLMLSSASCSSRPSTGRAPRGVQLASAMMQRARR